MLVGSIGLIAAAPITTALAALLASRVELASARPRRTRALDQHPAKGSFGLMDKAACA